MCLLSGEGLPDPSYSKYRHFFSKLKHFKGKILEKQHVLLRLLDKKFGGIDEAEKKRVMNIRERDRLDRAIDLILDPKSIDEVLHALEK
ncbi:hypothetical protein LCGC14_3134170 [marine sediment metagenome]|uniref:DUF4351 domain-containing protein n=1 Tax=marine sediment metagenome TaxID=412755 RepID=A0A0F8VYU1_9ZZZZ